MAEANPAITNMSDEDPSKSCDPCEFMGINNQAETYCQDCSEYLCHSCENVHRSSKASRNHDLKTLQGFGNMTSKQRALVSSIMTCDVHRDEVITLFCSSHKTVICNTCNSLKHRKCDTKPVRQVAKEPQPQQQVSQCSEEIKGLLKELKEIKDYRDKNKKRINDSSKKCLQQVTNVKRRIIAWAEKLANDMSDKIKQTKVTILADLEEDTKALTKSDKHIQEITNSFETLGQDLEEAAFVLMMKEGEGITDTTELKNDMIKQPRPVTLGFEESENLVSMMSKFTSMGKLVYEEQRIHRPDIKASEEPRVCFQDISSVTTNTSINAVSSWVSGCTFMPDGELVICDRTNTSVKVFTQDFKLRNEMKLGSKIWDVATLSKNEVIVTEPDSKCLQILNISRNIEKGKSVSVSGGMRIWGIDIQNDRIYVSCHNDDERGGKIKLLTLDGVTVNTFNISKGDPYYLAVNGTGDRILVSTNKHGVSCFDNSGTPLYTYSDSQLDWSRGLLFDTDDNFLVCGGLSYTVHVVKSDGTKHSIPLTSTDGLDRPRCLAYRPSDKTLVVGQHVKNSLLSFTIK